MELIYKIIILLGILAGLLSYKKTKPIFLKLILIGYVLIMSTIFFKEQFPITIAFFSFGILTFMFIIYSGINKKWMSLLIGFIVFLSFSWSTMNWIGGNEIRLLSIIPILSFILILSNRKKYENELSILTILSVYELTEFIILIEQWND